MRKLLTILVLCVLASSVWAEKTNWWLDAQFSNASVYPFIEGTGFPHDYGPHSNNITAGNIGWTNRHETAGAFYFADAAGYMTMTSSPSLNFGTADFTVAFWLKQVGALNNYAVIFEKSSGNGYYTPWSLAIEASEARWFHNWPTYSTAFTPGDWTHYAFVRHSGVLTLYIGGTSNQSAALSDDLDSTYQWQFGAGVSGSAFIYMMSSLVIETNAWTAAMVTNHLYITSTNYVDAPSASAPPLAGRRTLAQQIITGWK